MDRARSCIFGDRVVAPDDASAAAWIGERLGEFGTVGGLVPSGFEGYVLVRPDLTVTEADGVLAAEVASIAERHTSTPSRTWFAIWEGYGWASARTLYAVRGRGAVRRLQRWWLRRRADREDRARRTVITDGLAHVPTFELPHRRYFLVTGPASAAGEVSEPGGSGGQRPDLWWPDDRAWFVATDTDLEWIYVGGTAALCDELRRRLGDRCAPVDQISTKPLNDVPR